MKILKEPHVQCAYCGRIFYQPVAHKCNTGFRKRHQKFITITDKNEE